MDIWCLPFLTTLTQQCPEDRTPTTATKSLSATMRSLRPPRPPPRTVKAPPVVFDSDSEEDTETEQKIRVKLGAERKKRQHLGGRDNLGMESDSSSTFSQEDGLGPEMVFRPPNIRGSTKDLRNGGIILNATKLSG